LNFRSLLLLIPKSELLGFSQSKCWEMSFHCFNIGEYLRSINFVGIVLKYFNVFLNIARSSISGEVSSEKTRSGGFYTCKFRISFDFVVIWSRDVFLKFSDEERSAYREFIFVDLRLKMGIISFETRT
jgi:hypothetical protein